MIVNTKVLLVIQALLGLMTLAGVLFAGWWMLSLDTDTSEAETRAQLTRLGASAAVHNNRFQSYEGVCGEIGVPSGYSCHDSDSGYAIEVPLGAGRYLCLDSQGFFSQTMISKGENTTCRRY